jgi:hypothetical protein
MLHAFKPNNVLFILHIIKYTWLIFLVKQFVIILIIDSDIEKRHPPANQNTKKVMPIHKTVRVFVCRWGYISPAYRLISYATNANNSVFFLAFFGFLCYFISMIKKLERILRTEQIGSPLHAWASAQIKELEAQEPSAQELEMARLDVQIANRSWKRREQSV